MARPAKAPALAPVEPSRAIVTHPVSIRELAQAVHADLAPRLRALAADVPRVMADPERVARALEKASVPCLLLIEALVGAGGQLPKETLLELLHARFGWDAKASTQALNEAADACLLVLMSVGRVGSRELSWYALLIEETAEQLAEATWGLSLPAVPEALEHQPVPEARLLQTQRDRIARLAGLIHFGVRANKAGTAANRTSLKKLAVVTQKTDVLLAEEVAEALAERILRTEGDLIVPDRTQLEALADGRLVWGAIAGLDRWIPSDRWVSEEALLRAYVLTQRTDVALPIWMRPWDYFAHGTLELAQARASLAYCAAQRVVVDGQTWLRRPAPRASKGDGHVTASLEVMLGPEATLDVVLKVALMAEPKRFDTVLTFKLTQASISSAVALGLDAASMIETLDRVGPYGIPANVRTMVEDWSRSARSARIRAVWSIELSSAETADVVARALGNRVVARPSSTLLLVDHALTAPEVALAKLGVKSSLAASASAQEAANPHALVPHPARDQRPGAVWLAKLEKAREEGLSLSPEALDEGFDSARIDPFEALRAQGAQQPDPALRAFYDDAAELLSAMSQELADWLASVNAMHRKSAFLRIEQHTLGLLQLAALSPESRAIVLRQARAPSGLVSDARALSRMQGHATPKGLAVLAQLAHPSARTAFDAACQGLTEAE